MTVPSGGTVVLGGLIKDRNGKQKDGVPLLSRLPLIGALFRNTIYNKQRTELVILIRPEVTNTPHEAIKESDRENEFMNFEPDLEYTLINPQQRQRTIVPEVRLRQSAPGLRQYSPRPAYVAPVPSTK